MSMATMERAVLAGAKDVLNNRGLRMKNIMEWSTGEIREVRGEVRVWVANPGAWVAVKEKDDKRKASVKVIREAGEKGDQHGK